jgi:hypothetical protein
LRVVVTESTVVELSLNVGTTKDSVTVNEKAPLLQTEGAQLGRVIDEHGVSGLPQGV